MEDIQGRYRIVVNYDTGDSFSQQPDQETEVWSNNDVAIAEQNAQRIKAQQEFFLEIERWERNPHRSPGKPVTSLPYIRYNTEYRWYDLYLLDDEKNEHKVYTGTWQGYFETFNYVEVKTQPYRL